MNTFQEIPASKLSLAMRKPVFGIGTNDVKYQVYIKVNGKQVTCPYYAVWVDMLRRCYNPKVHIHHPTYVGCSVYKDWLMFSSFKSWMMTQAWENNHLDKDLLIRGNKIYSPETCMFVSPEVNSLLSGNNIRRGTLPIGVTWHEGTKKYRALCSKNNRQIHLGLFDFVNDASNAYRKFKKEVILEVANLQNVLQVRHALIRIANEEYN